MKYHIKCVFDHVPPPRAPRPTVQVAAEAPKTSPITKKWMKYACLSFVFIVMLIVAIVGPTLYFAYKEKPYTCKAELYSKG